MFGILFDKIFYFTKKKTQSERKRTCLSASTYNHPHFNVVRTFFFGYYKIWKIKERKFILNYFHKSIYGLLPLSTDYSLEN